MTKLNDYERQNLINQFRIIDALNSSNENAEAIKVLVGGFEGYYNEKVFQELEKSKSASALCLAQDVLHMHEVAIQSYEHLEDNEKSDDLEHKVMFKGFDANTQDDLYRCVQYLLDDLKLYEKVKNSTSSYNSNSSIHTITEYAVQVAKFKEYEISNVYLTKNQLENIFG